MRCCPCINTCTVDTEVDNWAASSSGLRWGGEARGVLQSLCLTASAPLLIILTLKVCGKNAQLENSQPIKLLIFCANCVLVFLVYVTPLSIEHGFW